MLFAQQHVFMHHIYFSMHTLLFSIIVVLISFNCIDVTKSVELCCSFTEIIVGTTNKTYCNLQFTFYIGEVISFSAASAIRRQTTPLGSNMIFMLDACILFTAVKSLKVDLKPTIPTAA